MDDPDNLLLQSATVVLGSGFNSAEDRLVFTDQNGITGNYDNTTGVLSLLGSATVTDYETALRSVAFENISENPDTTIRSVTYTASDGLFPGNTVTRNIEITAINDPVVLAGIENIPLNYTENDAATAVSSTLTVTDLDQLDLQSACLLYTSDAADE